MNSLEENLVSPYMLHSGKSVSFKQQFAQNEPHFVQVYGAQDTISSGQRKIKKIEKIYESGLIKQTNYGQRHLSRRHERAQPSIVRGREIEEKYNAYQSNVVQKQEKFFRKIVQQTEDNIIQNQAYQTGGLKGGVGSYGQIMLKMNYNQTKSAQRNQFSTATINQNLNQVNSKMPPRPKSNFRSNMRGAKVNHNLQKESVPNLQQKIGAQSISSNRYQQNQIQNVENSIISLNTSINHPQVHQNLYDNISPDQRHQFDKKSNLQSINQKEESVLSIKNMSSIGSDIKAYQSALSEAIHQDQQVLQSIQKNWDEVSKRITQRTNLLQTLQAPNDENPKNVLQGNIDIAQSQQCDFTVKNSNHMRIFSQSQPNDFNQIGKMLQQIYDRMAKLESDQDIQNQLKNISLQGNKEDILESLLQTLDASEAKKKSQFIKNLPLQIYETQLSQQYNPITQTNQSSIDTKSKLKDDIQRLAQIYRSGLSSSSQAYNTQNMVTPINQITNNMNQQDIRKKYVSLDPYFRVKTIDPKIRAAGKLTYIVEDQGANFQNQQYYNEKKNIDVSNKILSQKQNTYNGQTSQNRSTQGSKARGTKDGHKSVGKQRPQVIENLMNSIGSGNINNFNQNQNRSLEYETYHQPAQVNDNKFTESQNQKSFNTITQKLKLSSNYGKYNGINIKKVASRQQSRVMSRSTLRINEKSSNDPAASTEIASQILNSNGSQSVGRARPKASNIADSTSVFINQKNRINLQKTNVMPSQVLNKIQLTQVIQNRLYQGDHQNTFKSQKNQYNQEWVNQKVDKLQPSVTLSSQIQNQNPDESALVLTHSPKDAQSNFINLIKQENLAQSLADNQFAEYNDACGSQLKDFQIKNGQKQHNTINRNKNQVNDKNSRAFSVQPAFKNQYKFTLDKDQKNNQLSSLSSGKLNKLKNNMIGYQEKQNSQNRGSNQQVQQLSSINNQNFIQTGRLRPQKLKNQKQQQNNSQKIKLTHNSKGSMTNLKQGIPDEVGRSNYHQQNILLGLGMSSQVIQQSQSNQQDFQRKYDKSQTIDQSKDVVQFQQQRTFQNCSQSPDPGVQIASHKARNKINDVQGIISDQFSFKNGKMRRVQHQNETIDSSNFVMNNRDRKNIQEFLSANNSLAALYNKFQNQDQVQNDHIEIKMTTGSTDLKFKTQQEEQQYDETQKIMIKKKEQIIVKQGKNIQPLRFSKASANPLLINDSLLRSHLSAAQSQFYQSDDDNNNYNQRENIRPGQQKNNQIVSESIQKFREKLNQRYQTEQEEMQGIMTNQNQFIQIIRGEEDDFQQIKENSQSESEISEDKNNQKDNDNSLVFGSPNKQKIYLNPKKSSFKIMDQNVISSTKKRAIKNLIPFHADDEPIEEENEETNQITSEQSYDQESQQKPVFKRKHVVSNQNSKELPNEWKVKNIVQSAVMTDENGKIIKVESNQGNVFDNSKTTICSVNTLNVQNNLNAQKLNKSNFLFGSNGNMISHKNVRYSHQNLFKLGESGQQPSILRKLQMKSVAVNNNKLNELPIFQKQIPQPDQVLQEEDINENLVNDSGFEEQNFQIMIDERVKQNNFCIEEQEVKHKGINLLNLSDQITERYAEEQDQTSMSQSQINSKMTSRKSITNNPEFAKVSQIEQNSISDKQILVDKKSFAQKIELIKSINSSFQNMNTNMFNPNDLQTESGEINQKFKTQRQKNKDSNCSDPDDVLIESYKDVSSKNESVQIKQKQKLKNNFVNQTSQSKISNPKDSNRSSIDINDEDILGDSGDIHLKIKQRKGEISNLQFYQNEQNKQQFIEQWPAAGALIHTNRERSNSCVGKSQVHSDDEIEVRRGLEQSMSSSKLKILQEQFME